MSTIYTTSSGTSFLTGTASGIDTASLITAAVNAKLKPANRLDDTIDKNTSRISAYQQLQTYTQDMLDALERLKSSSTTKTSAFDEKQVTTKSSDSTSPDNILTASAAANTAAGSYRVVVQQLAQAMSVTSATQSSSSGALGFTGSFDLGLEGYTASTINITAGMSLSDIASAINATTSSSGVQASLMQTGSGYKLVLTGTDTAKEFSISNVSGDNVLQGLGITNSSGSFATVSQAAQQAIITFNGTTIESDSNTLENVISGLTLTLDNAAPSTTITVTVGNNTDGVKEAVQDFVDAYNTLRKYLAQQQAVVDGAVSSTAYLFGESIVRTMSQSLSQMITRSYGSSDYNSLGALGITLNASNELELDETVLETALSSDFNAARSFFATSSSNAGLADTLYTTLNAYGDSSKGDITTRINELTTLNSDLTSRSDRIKEQADTYQTVLVNKYATMEAQIERANILKRQIEAILQGTTNND